ncbi:VPA1269 family protein [Paraburkholderia youngii]|uniref:VPA1269 family protein n=1 Tax=Paraburkholderia youngii TaxID=2782701 RepID=UPI003D1E026E
MSIREESTDDTSGGALDQELPLTSDWESFSRILSLASKSGTKAQRANIQSLLLWTHERGIASPAGIKVTDIATPGTLNRTETFTGWLEERVRNGSLKEGTAYGYWSNASLAFSQVSNFLKIAPNETLRLEINPFEPHRNPFRYGYGNPTAKARLPETLQEALLDVLLEPDSDGNPTFSWFKGVFGYDWFYPEADGVSLQEKIWCPSRAHALALLLMLPFRKKQVRWLDRGLLDETIWDVETHSYIPNQHPLRSWTYPDGSTHRERYGRSSGVLQELADPLFHHSQLGLFVNTSKVAMWSPETRRGYDLPWPFIEAEHFTKVGSDVAHWLNRPYLIIFEQIRWMNLYLPSPKPVSFADTKEDRAFVNERHLSELPCFTPLFAGCTSLKQDEHSASAFFVPVTGDSINKAFSALCLETERRFGLEGRYVELTKPSESSRGVKGRQSAYEIHGLRVAGISRLIEAGVPVSIVQEFVANHATAVMTLHYKRADRQTLKTRLIESLQRQQTIHRWRDQREVLSRQPEAWSSNRHQHAHRGDDLLETFVGWIFVPGGICPVSGMLCDIGHVNEASDLDQSQEHFSPVEGGCGNCRFFSTGPAFIIDQALALNEIMLELRMRARTRKSLLEKVSELSWSQVPGLSPVASGEISRSLEGLRDEIAAIDRVSDPLILEWMNRYRMFEDSKWRLENIEFSNLSPSDGSSSNPRLVTSGSISDIQHEVEVKLEESGDFSLVLNILEAATIHGGLEHASSLSKEVCCEFMERILRAEGSSSLLMDIETPRTRERAAYELATMAEALVGTGAVQEALDKRGALPFNRSQQEAFLRLAKDICTSTAPSGRSRGEVDLPTLEGSHEKIE